MSASEEAREPVGCPQPGQGPLVDARTVDPQPSIARIDAQTVFVGPATVNLHEAASVDVAIWRTQVLVVITSFAFGLTIFVVPIAIFTAPRELSADITRGLCFVSFGSATVAIIAWKARNELRRCLAALSGGTGFDTAASIYRLKTLTAVGTIGATVGGVGAAYEAKEIRDRSGLNESAGVPANHSGIANAGSVPPSASVSASTSAVISTPAANGSGTSPTGAVADGGGTATRVDAGRDIQRSRDAGMPLLPKVNIDGECWGEIQSLAPRMKSACFNDANAEERKGCFAVAVRVVGDDNAKSWSIRDASDCSAVIKCFEAEVAKVSPDKCGVGATSPNLRLR